MSRSAWPRPILPRSWPSPIADRCWEVASYVVAAPDHPLRRKPRLTLADTLGERWAIPPRGTGPFEHMQHVFAEQGLLLPKVVDETRSITARKSVVAHSGFLSSMALTPYVTESKVGVFDTFSVPGHDRAAHTHGVPAAARQPAEPSSEATGAVTAIDGRRVDKA
nr:LysR substrate-binding domain-containing protein [Paraburkholderia sp. SG-MS1]